MGEPEQRPYQNIGLKLISVGGLNEHRRKLDCFTGLNKIAKLDPYTDVPYFTVLTEEPQIRAKKTFWVDSVEN